MTRIVLNQNVKSLFKSYNMKGCQFECRLKYAIKQSKCIPWDYPKPLDDDGKWDEYEVCQSNSNEEELGPNGLAAFEDAINSDASLKTCDCLPNCQEVTFDTQVSKSRGKAPYPDRTRNEPTMKPAQQSHTLLLALL